MTWLWSWWCVIFRYVALYELSGPVEPRGQLPPIFCNALWATLFPPYDCLFLLASSYFQTFRRPCFVWTLVLCGNPLTFSKAYSLLTLRYISTILYNRKSNFELNTKNPHWSIWEYICLFLFYFSDMYQHFRVCLYLYINIGHSISGLVEPGK